MKCVIVGSGPSAKYFHSPDECFIIAVNDAINHVGRVDAFFTLDHSEKNMKILHRFDPEIEYHASFPSHIVTPGHVNRWERIAKRGDEPSPKGTPEWWLWRWSAVPTLCEDEGCIHSGNSAWGALGVAYHMGFRDVALVGVDATDDVKPDGTRPNNLSHLPMLFASALDQINVVSCGMLNSVPQMSIMEFLDQ